MTSIVDTYYRKISENIDNIRMKFDISALLVKSTEHDSKIDTNKNNISSNTSLIDTNKSDIVNNLSKINTIEKISDEVFNDKYDIVNQSFNFNKNTHSYQLFEKVIETNMTTGELIINTIIDYKYDNLESDINRLTHLYEFFDNKNVLFYSITLDNHDFGVPSNSDLNINGNFCFNINNKNNIKLVLSLTRINEWGDGNINLEMIDNNSINIIYNKKADISNKFNENDKKINTNKNNISSNTSLIDTNKNNISSNTSLIDTNKNNISSNTSLIDTNKNNISSNTTFIDTNRDNIATNLTTLNNIDLDLTNLRDNISSHQTDIQSLNGKVFKLNDSYKLKDIIIIDIIKSQIPEAVDSNNEFVIINSSLDNLKKDCYIQFDSSILIFFHKHYINIAFFHILLEYFNDKKVLIDSIKMPIIGMISRYTNITNSCIIKIPNDLDKIYYKLSIKLNEGQNRSDNVSILDFDNKYLF